MKNNVNNLLKAIGSNIRKIRKEKRVSIKELAMLANVSTSYLYKIEKCKCIMSFNTLLNIACALGTKIKDLLRE